MNKPSPKQSLPTKYNINNKLSNQLPTNLYKQSTNVYQFQEFNQYKSNHRPQISAEKQESIQTKLQLQKIAEDRAIKRIKNQDYFIGNPQKYLHDGTFDKDRYTLQTFKNKFYTVKMAEKINKNTNSTENNGQFNENDDDSNEGHKNKNKQKDMSLQDIMNMKDECYYSQQVKDKNIFRILKNNCHPFTSQDLVKKYHFTLSSTEYSTSKLPNNAEHYISSKIRSLAIGRTTLNQIEINQIFKGNQLQINLSQIRFVDLINISCGKLNPKIVNDILKNNLMQSIPQNHPSPYNNKSNNHHSSDQQDQETIIKQIISYKPQSKHIACNFQSPYLSKQEIKDYLILPYEKQQIRQQRHLTNTIHTIKSQLATKDRLVDNTIKDKLLHRQITKSTNTNLEYIESKIRNDSSDMNMDRLIRQFKNSKDRYERIRLEKLIEGLKMVKASQKKYSHLQ